MSQTLREILAPYVPERLLTDAEDAVSVYVSAQADEAYRDGKEEGYSLALEAESDFSSYATL